MWSRNRCPAASIGYSSDWRMKRASNAAVTEERGEPMPRSALTIDVLTKQASEHLRVAEAELALLKQERVRAELLDTRGSTVEGVAHLAELRRGGMSEAAERRRLSVVPPKALLSRIRTPGDEFAHAHQKRVAACRFLNDDSAGVAFG